MLKKTLMLGASLLLASFTTTSMAGAPVVLPTYDLYPVTGSINVAGSESGNGGSQKIVKDSGNAKTIIRLALGGDADVPATNEKNFVLAFANPDDESCSGEILVWDKVNQVVKAEIALVSATDCDEETVSSFPAEGKSGTYTELFTLKVDFVGAGENSCGTLDTSVLSGRGIALGQYSEKISVKSGQETTVTPVSVNFTRLLGNLSSQDGQDSEHLVITDGSFKTNLSPTKKLNTQGSVSTAITLNCDS